MEIEKLFAGVAVIVDNEINDDESDISKIKGLIEKKNIPVLTYSAIPNLEVVTSLSSVSFIIMDWDFFDALADGEERIYVPDELRKESEKTLLKFIDYIQQNIFTPVFIFTALNPNTVQNTLIENKLLNDRIFIMQKTAVQTEKDLFSAIEKWLVKMPSVYVLKQWESTILKAKDALFLEMFTYSPNWPSIIWKMLQSDGIDSSYEFGTFVSRNLINRINSYSFDNDVLKNVKVIPPEELAKVVEGERFLTYQNQPDQAYTGDLFLNEGTYFLNISAQCDIVRDANPTLYCIKGKSLENSDITINDIELTLDEEMKFSDKDRVPVGELVGICHNEEARKEINSKFVNHRNGIFLNKGEILEKKLEIIIACVANAKVLKFRTEIIPKKFTEIKANRIGRILPPYITRIQQKCAQNLVREGTMPYPIELFRT